MLFPIALFGAERDAARLTREIERSAAQAQPKLRVDPLPWTAYLLRQADPAASMRLHAQALELLDAGAPLAQD